MRTDDEIMRCMKSARHCDNCEDYHRCEEIILWKKQNPKEQRAEDFYILQEIKRMQDFGIILDSDETKYIYSLKTRREVDRYREKRIKEKLNEV